MPEFVQNGTPHGQNGNPTVRFGMFEADLRLGEIRKSGSRIKLQDQPFRILQILLERPGELVSREELRSRIWPDESYGDFDHAVNVAVGKLRSALGDSADSPSYIETVPRRGYRFVATLDGLPKLVDHPGPAVVSAPPTPSGESRPKTKWMWGAGAVVLAIALVAAGVFAGRHTAGPPAPEYQRITFRHGTVFSARFAPDGHSVIYSASWEGGPVEIFASDLNFSGTRSLGLPGTAVLAVSASGEMAVIESAICNFMLTLRGTLGQVPITGGSPRQMAEKIQWADYSPDGKTLAVVRSMGGLQRLEFPLGHVLYETTGWISHPRVSPRGDQIAFLDHPTSSDDRGMVSVVDMQGHKRVLSTGWESEEGLAWSTKGDEVLFSATQAGLQRRIYSVDLLGKVRLRFTAPGGVTLEDVAPDGRMLLTRDEPRAGIMGFAPGDTRERDLSWLDWSLPVDISPDGAMVLFDEQGEQGGPAYTVAMRNIHGSPPVALGEGMAGGFSPDGKWVSATLDYTQIVLLPTGAGNARKLDPGGIQQYGHPVRWMPDGKQLLFIGNEAGHQARCYLQNVDGGRPRPVTSEGVSMCQPSPDGKWVASVDLSAGVARLYPTSGGDPQSINGLAPDESFWWSADPKIMYVVRGKQGLPEKVYKLNIQTGKREFFKELTPTDTTGICDLGHFIVSRDGRAYIYGYTRLLSDLYLVKGIQ